jgi:crotonobetainyl-CoA hydratase
MSESATPPAGGTAGPPVIVSRRDHVMTVTLNRPRARNAVNMEVSVLVGAALEEAEHDASVWAVIITGAGEVAFCAGGDLKARANGEPVSPAEGRGKAWGFAGYVRHSVSKPTIAAVNGYALGGGTEIVLASDLAVAADTATFGLPEVQRGIFAGAGGVFRLPAQLPKKVAMEMILTGEPITARRALELGLVNRVVAPSLVLDTARELAERICRNAPLAVQASKRIANGIVDESVVSEEPAWQLSAREAAALKRTADAAEGSRAFGEKRPAVWQGR